MICILLLLMMVSAVQLPVSYANEVGISEEEEPKENQEEDSKEDLGEDSGETGEEEPEEPEKPVIEKYELTIPKEDGEHGYYVTKPEIYIRHVSEYGVTKYQLYHGKELVKEEELKEKDQESILKQEQFEEGAYRLSIWMEDQEGQNVEGTMYEHEWKIDTIAPEVVLSLPRGFDAWYQQETELTIQSKDAGSKVNRVLCTSGEQKLGEFQGAQGSVKVNLLSTKGQGVEVEVCVSDYAGNRTVEKERIYIDGSSPQVMIAGAENYMITSKPVHLSLTAMEDNAMRHIQAQVLWENIEGKQKKMNVQEWDTTGACAKATQTLEKDGLYEIIMKAEDMSGYQAEKKLQVIVDQENPVIQHVDELDNQYMKVFQWKYDLEELIRDFTTYTYEIRLDGKMYVLGRTVEQEGSHTLEIKARDAADNVAVARAEFVIDHTKPEIIFDDIEDGGTYEKQKTFKIALKDTGDTIKKITINGKEQNLSNRKIMTYEYTVDKPQDYRVIVQAVDRAGNESERDLFFVLEPEKTVLQKITEPMKKVLLGEKDTTERVNGDMETKSKESNFPIWSFSFLIIIPVSVLAFRNLRKKKASGVNVTELDVINE